MIVPVRLQCAALTPSPTAQNLAMLTTTRRSTLSIRQTTSADICGCSPPKRRFGQEAAAACFQQGHPPPTFVTHSQVSDPELMSVRDTNKAYAVFVACQTLGHKMSLSRTFAHERQLQGANRAFHVNNINAVISVRPPANRHFQPFNHRSSTSERLITAPKLLDNHV